MYIQNRRDSSKLKGCSPFQLLSGLIGLESAIAYFAYTHRLWVRIQHKNIYHEKNYEINNWEK